MITPSFLCFLNCSEEDNGHKQVNDRAVEMLGVCQYNKDGICPQMIKKPSILMHVYMNDNFLKFILSS